MFLFAKPVEKININGVALWPLMIEQNINACEHALLAETRVMPVCIDQMKSGKIRVHLLVFSDCTGISNYWLEDKNRALLELRTLSSPR